MINFIEIRFYLFFIRVLLGFNGIFGLIFFWILVGVGRFFNKLLKYGVIIFYDYSYYFLFF